MQEKRKQQESIGKIIGKTVRTFAFFFPTYS